MIPLAIIGGLVCLVVLAVVLVGSALSQGDIDSTPRPPQGDENQETGQGNWK